MIASAAQRSSGTETTATGAEGIVASKRTDLGAPQTGVPTEVRNDAAPSAEAHVETVTSANSTGPRTPEVPRSGGEAVVMRAGMEATTPAGATAAPQTPEAVNPPVTESAAGLRPQSVPAPAATDPAPQAVTGLRLTHQANGLFDMIVVQTDLADLVPSSRAVMAGKQVYTVYLQVGDNREWVLHFCAVDSKTIQNGSIVTLGDPRPLAPPYPRLTVLPSHIPPSETKVILVHGLIDETGTMRGLRVLGGEDNGGRSENLLTALAHWQFRPAKRGADATPVEVLLEVPTTHI